MKIVILGNGFDLASGLPTGYEHFFGHNEKKYRKELENIKVGLQNLFMGF